MNDTDDIEIDDELVDDEEFNELEVVNNFTGNELSSKRDVRSEIEKRLELMELQKLIGDSLYDEVFN
jgi:hypothetical protein